MDGFLRVRNEGYRKLACGVGILVNAYFITQHTIRDFNMGSWTFLFPGYTHVRIPSTPFSSPTAMPSGILLASLLAHSPNGIREEEACPG